MRRVDSFTFTELVRGGHTKKERKKFCLFIIRYRYRKGEPKPRLLDGRCGRKEQSMTKNPTQWRAPIYVV